MHLIDLNQIISITYRSPDATNFGDLFSEALSLIYQILNDDNPEANVLFAGSNSSGTCRENTFKDHFRSSC